MWNEFKEFTLRGNVVDMAIGLLLGEVDFSSLFINLSRTPYDSLAHARAAGAPAIPFTPVQRCPDRGSSGSRPLNPHSRFTATHARGSQLKRRHRRCGGAVFIRRIQSVRIRRILPSPLAEEIAMKRIRWPALAGLLLCCAVVNAPIAPAGESSSFYKPPPPPTWYLFCTAAQPKRELEDESVIPEAIYYSGAFTVTTRNLNPVNDAFLKFLQERYGYQLAPSLSQPIMCYSRQNLADAQAERQKYLSQSLKYTAQAKVVETGWTFGGTTVVP